MNGREFGPTTYGQTGDQSLRLAAASQLPSYVVACGMALFRGPDGHLWFAPDAMGRPNIFDWYAAENLAAWDARHDTGRLREVGYLSCVAELCVAVDAAIRADQRYHATAHIAVELIPVYIDL